MKKYVYAIVIVSADQQANSVVIAGGRSVKGLSLSKVLDRGWTPIRETPMGGGPESFCSLVLLEKDGDDEPTEVTEVAEEPAPPPAPKKAPAPKPKEKPAEPKQEAKPSDSDISFEFLDVE